MNEFVNGVSSFRTPHRISKRLGFGAYLFLGAHVWGEMNNGGEHDEDNWCLNRFLCGYCSSMLGSVPDRLNLADVTGYWPILISIRSSHQDNRITMPFRNPLGQTSCIACSKDSIRMFEQS